MKEIGLEEMKSLQVAILNDFSEFCERQNMVYFLTGGTLLGAIRHNGYIPWDDDIDVAMPREDYERFIKGFHQDKYLLKNPHYDSSYYYPFTKIVDDRTMIIERSEENTNLGVYIDVFPIDAIPKNKVKGYYIKRKMIELIMTCRMAQKDKNRKLLKRGSLFILRNLFFKVDLNKLAVKIDDMSRKYAMRECELAGNLMWGYGAREIVSKDIFEGYKETTFENNSYKVPIKSHEYLCAIYGDYMKLPPEEKRVLKHNVTAFWK